MCHINPLNPKTWRQVPPKPFLKTRNCKNTQKTTTFRPWNVWLWQQSLKMWYFIKITWSWMSHSKKSPKANCWKKSAPFRLWPNLLVTKTIQLNCRPCSHRAVRRQVSKQIREQIKHTWGVKYMEHGTEMVYRRGEVVGGYIQHGEISF